MIITTYQLQLVNQYTRSYAGSIARVEFVPLASVLQDASTSFTQATYLAPLAQAAISGPYTPEYTEIVHRIRAKANVLKLFERNSQSINW